MDKVTDMLTKIHNIGPKLQSGEYKLVKRRGRSEVWKIFSGILDENGEELRNFVYCTRCEKVYKCHQLSTSNLIKHATSHLKKEDTISIKTEELTTQVVETTANKLMELLTRWIIKDCIPYDCVNSENLKAVFEGFARLGATLDAHTDIGQTMPMSSDYTQNVSEIYDQCFDMVKTDIAAIKENGFGLTADIWTNNFIDETYIAVTIHYLIKGVLTFRLLGLTTLEQENSTNKSLVKKIQETLQDFDLKLTGKSILVTNANDDILKAFPDTPIIPCMSQLLQNALEKSMEEIPEITEIINTCFKLVSILNKLKLTTLLGSFMPASCPSQWQNIYKMLKAVESNWTEIKEALQNQNKIAIILTINIKYLKAMVKTFEPFEEAIEALEDDSYATLHLVMVYLHELRKSCSINGNEFIDFECIENLKKNLCFNLEKIVSENITTLHKLALFLYPPTNKLLQFSDKEKQCVEKECIRIMKCFENDLKTAKKQEPAPSTTPASKRLKLFADFVESKADVDPNKLINEEIQSYKNTYVPNTADFDVFSWWKVQKSNFPLLYKLSCTVLATPATSAVTKRIFSAANFLLCEKSKQDISETDVEKIMFINLNADDNEI